MSSDVGDSKKIEDLLESFEKKQTRKEEQVKVKEKTWKTLLKYFIHGISFSILFVLLEIAWIFAFVGLLAIGSFIGLILGVVLFVLIIGALNSFLTGILWFRVKTSIMSIIGHGIALFVVLIVAEAIFVLTPSLIFPRIETRIISFIIMSFLYGFLGKKVAGWWKEEYEEAVPESVQAELEDKNL